MRNNDLNHLPIPGRVLCHSSKIWINGFKANGRQNFRCADCRKQFQQEYVYKGCSQKVSRLVVKMLIRNCGLKDIQYITGVHRQTVLKILEQKVGQSSFKHWQSSYDLVQVDELYSFVDSKENKQWLIYAYAPVTDEALVRGG